jgi:hypothetical protein
MVGIAKVDIVRLKVPLDPSADIFIVEITYANGSIWKETLDSETELNAFLRGLRAG